MNYNVLIIGSGLGGLECGALLAKRGLKVLVLEGSNQPGGCMQSFRRGGMHYDTGLHYVGGLAPGQTMHHAFEELGLLDLPWQRMDDAFDHVIIGGRHFAFHQGYEAFVEGLAKDFPHQREALQAFVQRLQNITADDMDVCAYDYLRQTFSDELLVNVVSAAAMKTELRRESLPLFNFAHTCSSYIESSWRLKGDGNLLVNKLISTIEEGGGKIRTNSKVVSLVEADGCIANVICADGQTYEAEYFISDIHPAVLCQLLEDCPSVRKAFRRRMTSGENTCGMFTAQFKLKHGALRYFAHNVFVYDKPNVWTMTEDNDPVKGVMISARVPEDDSDELRQIDLLTPMPWHECKPWTETRVGRRGADYKAFCQKKNEQCMALAEQYIPNLHEMVEQCYTSTPLTYRDYLGSPEGGAFGLRKDCRASMLSFHSVGTPFPNLLLTGQNIILPGIEGVTMTAFETCSRITQDNAR
ncbi:MAG: NAD(P)/FAD-dependent oxidoreductase [Bacteroidaceae bacterium]|nr:NAD(P)/FAD-dependent oxidoreductase [Bacteroidaceae bacterium]